MPAVVPPLEPVVSAETALGTPTTGLPDAVDSVHGCASLGEASLQRPATAPACLMLEHAVLPLVRRLSFEEFEISSVELPLMAVTSDTVLDPLGGKSRGDSASIGAIATDDGPSREPAWTVQEVLVTEDGLAAEDGPTDGDGPADGDGLSAIVLPATEDGLLATPARLTRPVGLTEFPLVYSRRRCPAQAVAVDQGALAAVGRRAREERATDENEAPPEVQARISAFISSISTTPPPSILGGPPASVPVTRTRRRATILEGFTPWRSPRLALQGNGTRRHTISKAQKVTMKKLGIIEEEEEANQEAVQEFEKLFDEPLPPHHVQAIAELLQIDMAAPLQPLPEVLPGVEVASPA